MIGPEIIKPIGWNPGELRIQIRLFGRYICEGIYIPDKNEVFVLGETLAQNFNRSFYELMNDDFWLDVMLLTRIEKHDRHGWIFYLIKTKN